MALGVKAYFTEGNGPEIIKRFSIDADVTTSFEYLRGKIIQAYPNLNGRNFSTYWHDKEGDQIIFSSDDELMQALTQIEEGILKIYIKIFPRTSQCSPPFNPFTGGFPIFPFMQPSMSEFKSAFPFMTPPNAGVHPGVTCDGCEGAVIGMRFKCQQCPDYDLCIACVQKQLHKEHTFFGIPHPINGPQEILTQCSAKCNSMGINNEMNMPQGESQKASFGNPSNDFQDLKNIGKYIETMLLPMGINFSIDVNVPPKAQQETKENIGVKCKTSCNNKISCNNLASCDKVPIDKMECDKKDSCKEICDLSNQTSCKMGSCNVPRDSVMLHNKNCSDNDIEMINVELPLSEKLDSNASDKFIENTRTGTLQSIGATPFRSESNWKLKMNEIPSKEDTMINMDERIKDSISKMKRLGFNDEGGWLTALIIATKGDINKALDLIQAKP